MMAEILGDDLPDLHNPTPAVSQNVNESSSSHVPPPSSDWKATGHDKGSTDQQQQEQQHATMETIPLDAKKEKRTSKSRSLLRKGSTSRNTSSTSSIASSPAAAATADDAVAAGGVGGNGTRRQRSVQFDAADGSEEEGHRVGGGENGGSGGEGGPAVEGASTSVAGKHTRRKSLTPVHRVRSKTVGGKWSVNAVGQVVYKNHESYTVMRQIQMGLRTAISDITPKKNRDLQSKDFHSGATIKWSFPSAGTLHTPPHDYEDFRFYDYGPMAFRHLRERFGIDASHFLVSLCHDKSLSILGTPGKSGALFFYSADMKYILKTITKKESKFLRKILPQYYNHVMSNPSTLITKFYGLYSIKPSAGRNVRFVIMNNVFDTRLKIEERYDLKGSTIGRIASEKELAQDNPVLKDIDLLQKKRKMQVGTAMKETLIHQLKTDCEFLESVKIMDYSLLVGIHQSNVTGGVLVDFDSPGKEVVRVATAESVTQETQPLASSLSSSKAADASNQSIDLNDEQRNETNRSSDNSIGNRASGHAVVRVDVVVEDGADDARDARPSSEDMSQKELGAKTSSFLDSVKNVEKKQRPSILNGIFRGGQNSKMHLENQKGHRVSEFQQFHGGVLSSDGEEIYFLGIIDLLQMWNNRKQMERMLKSFRYDRKQISSVSPKKYASRFLRFLDENTV